MLCLQTGLWKKQSVFGTFLCFIGDIRWISISKRLLYWFAVEREFSINFTKVNFSKYHPITPFSVFFLQQVHNCYLWYYQITIDPQKENVHKESLLKILYQFYLDYRSCSSLGTVKDSRVAVYTPELGATPLIHPSRIRLESPSYSLYISALETGDTGTWYCRVDGRNKHISAYHLKVTGKWW